MAEETTIEEAEETTIEEIKDVMQQTVDDMHTAMSIITIAQTRMEKIYSDMTASLERVMQAKDHIRAEDHIRADIRAELMEQGLSQFFNEYAQFSKELRKELFNIEIAGLLLEDTLGEVALTIGIEPKAWNEKPGEEREC